MSDTAASLPVQIEKTSQVGYPQATLRYNWTSAILSAWLVGGLYLDGWAHSHGRVDNFFFTPWHALLYSGVFVTLLFLLINLLLNHARGFPWGRALPQGYSLSLLGAGLFMVGGGLDLIWHRLFGIEVDIETLLSPTHLLLATAGTLMITGTVRSAWAQVRTGEAMRGWKKLGPSTLAVTLTLSVLTFFTQFSNPIRNTYALKDPTLGASYFPDLYKLNADGTGQTRLTGEEGMYAWSADWSPDGKQVVFTHGAASQESPNGQLYLMNLDGSGLKQLTHVNKQAWTPAWSPDGKHIAFIQAGEGTQQLALIDADGSHFKQLTPASVLAYGPAWSPDASQLVYTSNATGIDQLYIISAAGGAPRQLTHSGGNNWGTAWSPDGLTIVYHSDREGVSGIFAIHPDGSSDTLLANLPGQNIAPAWSPDGKSIIFVNNKDNISNLYRMDANGGNQRNLSHNYALEFIFPRWSPDGKSILVTGNGHNTQVSNYYTQSISLTGLLLLAAMLSGCILLVLKGWQPPFGALTLMFGLNAALMSVLGDNYWLIIPAALAGAVCDLLLLALKPSLSRPRRLHLFAFAAPVIYFSLYYLALQLNGGISWTIHLWLGSIAMAGIVGLFLSLLLTQGGETKSVPSADL